MAKSLRDGGSKPMKKEKLQNAKTTVIMRGEESSKKKAHMK